MSRSAPPPGVGPLDVLAFVAEVAMLVGLGLVGWSLSDIAVVSWPLAVLLPCAAAAVWGAWCAPRARRRLRRPGRWALKVTLFAVTFLLLMGYGPRPGAGWFGLGMWIALLASLPADRGR